MWLRLSLPCPYYRHASQPPRTLRPPCRPPTPPPQPGTSSWGSATKAPPGSSIPPLPPRRRPARSPAPALEGRGPDPKGAGAGSLPFPVPSRSRNAQAIQSIHRAGAAATFQTGGRGGQGQRVPQTPAKTSAPERRGCFIRGKDIASPATRKTVPVHRDSHRHQLRVNSSPEDTPETQASGPVGTPGATAHAKRAGALCKSRGPPHRTKSTGRCQHRKEPTKPTPRQAINPRQNPTQRSVAPLAWTAWPPCSGPAQAPSTLSRPAQKGPAYRSRALPLQGSIALAL